MEKRFLEQREKLRDLTLRIRKGQPVNREKYDALSDNTIRLARKITEAPPGTNNQTILKNALRQAQNIGYLNEYRKWRWGHNMSTKHRNYAYGVYNTNNLNMARNMIVNKMHGPAKKIQRAFRQRKKLTNENYIRLYHGKQFYRDPNDPLMHKIRAHVGKTTGKKPPKNLNYFKESNYTEALNVIRKKRGTAVAPQVTTIQRIFRGYKSRNINKRIEFLESLHRDGRFEYYVKVLAKLETRVPEVLGRIVNDPQGTITKMIGVCHFSTRPQARVQNVTNVRKSLKALRKKDPREYLMGLRRQFAYVSRAYNKMNPPQRKEYRDRLHSELSGRPCLENMLDSLVKALVKPEFVWLGKTKAYENTPLVTNNARYLGPKGLMNTAVTTWALSKNRPTNWNSKNVNTRKAMFWNMVKNLPVAMVQRGTIVNGTPRNYNVNGKLFKKSNLANTLEYA